MTILLKAADRQNKHGNLVYGNQSLIRGLQMPAGRKSEITSSKISIFEKIIFIMKLTLMTLAFITLFFAYKPASAQFTQAQLVKEWERSKIYTQEYLDAMPEEGYTFKPTPEIRSFGEQMLHLAEANYFFAATASGIAQSAEQKAVEKTPLTKSLVTKAVMDSYDFMISCLKNMPPDKMEEISKSKIQGVQLSNANLYGKAFEHQAHTRGQTTIYLRLKGITPPKEKLF